LTKICNELLGALAVSVNTKQVQGRRKLRFSSYDEMLADARALAARPTRQLGNWSLGQICAHLASAKHSCIDGAPFSPPWIVRLVGPFLKNRVLTRGLSPGFQVPKNTTSLLPPETTAAVGIAALEKAVDRLQQNPERKPHAVFGQLTREEWDQFLLRHAEMHLSFIVPESPAAS
jgi:hypothetical protein